jgi:lysophospholipase L1-like esterase
VERIAGAALGCVAAWLAVGACSGPSSSAPGWTSLGGASPTTGSAAEQPTTSTSGGAGTGTTTSSTGAAGSGASGTAGSGGQGGDVLLASECFADDYVTPLPIAPDYDPFGPVIGSHCLGTNHQDIGGVERVVFLGDSITVGTPPNLPEQCYRSLLAEALALRFGIAAPAGLWKAYDPVTGKAVMAESGAFASCSQWGARVADLLQGGQQVAECFPPETLAKRTLVIMTVGGNDLASLTQDAINGASQAELQATTEQWIATMREAVAWFRAPGRFPNGVFVVLANIPEFTDGTGEVQACDMSGLAGFSDPVPYPLELADVVFSADEQYLSIAVEQQVDMIFMFEQFCGHGFNCDEPSAPCYRGPGQSRWFDLTCIHPNPEGHSQLANMFLAVVSE